VIGKNWRRGPGSNRRIKVLQTFFMMRKTLYSCGFRSLFLKFCPTFVRPPFTILVQNCPKPHLPDLHSGYLFHSGNLPLWANAVERSAICRLRRQPQVPLDPIPSIRTAWDDKSILARTLGGLPEKHDCTLGKAQTQWLGLHRAIPCRLNEPSSAQVPGWKKTHRCRPVAEACRRGVPVVFPASFAMPQKPPFDCR